MNRSIAFIATCLAAFVAWHSQGHGQSAPRFLPLGTGGGDPNSASFVRGISADGAIVVGGSTFLSGGHSFRWTEETGMLPLDGDLPTGISTNGAAGISGDGNLIYGTLAPTNQPYLWTQAGGFQIVAIVPTGTSFDASIFVKLPEVDVSADGSAVVGTELHSIFGDEAYRDTPEGRDWLGDLPGGTYRSGASAISPMGNAVVGGSTTLIDNMGVITETSKAFRWTEAEGMVALSPGHSVTFDVSSNGLVVVGYINQGSGVEAARWTPATGMVPISELLLEQGIDITAMGWTLDSSAVAVSADGQTIVGNGKNPQGVLEAWLVNLSIPGDFNHNGIGDGRDFLNWQRGFGKTSGATEEDGDANHDMAVDASDFAIWKTQYLNRVVATESSNSALIPEPSACVLILISIFGFVLSRTRL